VANAILERYLPGLLGTDRGGRVFCDGYAPDGSPVAIPHPESPAFVVAGAGAGAGFRFAPALAEHAVQMVM
jgi:D-hydroxyproline dehydrogenase subunit beta